MGTERTQPDSEWLTTTQAGLLLGLSSMTVSRMCDDGRLEHTRPAGKQRRIHRAVIESHLAAVTRKAKTPMPSPVPTPMPPKPVPEVRKSPDVFERIRRLAAE